MNHIIKTRDYTIVNQLNSSGDSERFLQRLNALIEPNNTRATVENSTNEDLYIVLGVIGGVIVLVAISTIAICYCKRRTKLKSDGTRKSVKISKPEKSDGDLDENLSSSSFNSNLSAMDSETDSQLSENTFNETSSYTTPIPRTRKVDRLNDWDDIESKSGDSSEDSNTFRK